jgi:hypothetical protein
MSCLRSNDTSRDEDGLECLLDCLLRKETGDVIGHVVVGYERAQSRLIADSLASNASATSCSSRFDKHPTLGKRGAKHRGRA